MMNVKEYAQDINKTVAEILAKCQALNLNINNEEDLLDEEIIITLDNEFANDNNDNEEIEIEVDDDVVLEIITKDKINFDDSIKKEKLKKKPDIITNKDKKELAIRKKEMYKHKEKLISNAPSTDNNVILYKEGMTLNDLASSLNIQVAELVKKLFNLGVMTTLNSTINFENAEILVADYNKELKKEETADVTNFEQFEIVENDTDLIKRPAVVTIMGHVDHGKTTLLDTIRKANVVAGEAGGITQHIGAYQISHNNELITFIDTPGHAAFTEMRARGASITDIVVIIVAADDGVMPQTKEAIDHAKAANVPIIVAINKIDKPNINVERVMTELANYDLSPEEWGGDTIYAKVSAATGDGIPELLDNILLITEMQELKANPNRYATGTVIESRLDKQKGPIVTLLIQNGTLRLGDPIVVGHAYGKVRTLTNDKKEEITVALPATPVEITGLNATPIAGDKFMAFETEKQARSIGEERKAQAKIKTNQATPISFEDMFAKIQEGAKEINVIIKADVNGSSEAIKNSLEKIEVAGVKINVVRNSVGAITESDIVLASASNAIIIGFNVRPNNEIKNSADEHKVDIRLYNIIYKLVEDIEAAMKGMLDPIYEEKVTGQAEVRQLFKFSKVGTIAGSMITDGVVKATNKARIIRDSVVIYDGKINSIQREKDSVKEVKKGQECGITIENYNDLKAGDIIESYEMVEIER